MFRKKKPEESPDPDTTNTAAPRQLPELKQLRFSRASLRYQILEMRSRTDRRSPLPCKEVGSMTRSH